MYISQMKWTAPPDRREITLVLFTLTVFILSYNLDSSLQLLGLSKLGLGGAIGIDKDGRKPPRWRDSLEDTVFGEWAWDEGHVAGNGAERSQEKGTGRYGAQWIGRSETGDVSGAIFGETSANDVLDWWDAVPRTQLVKHTPVYTILDSPILFNGSVYVVEDDLMSIPPIGSIASPKPGSEADWKVISGPEAKDMFGSYAGRIMGVTFLSNDASPHSSTLLSLWRTYSSLDSSIDAAGRTTLSPPHRLIFTRIPVFSDFLDTPVDPAIIRPRSETGFHPFLAKAAFPALGIMFEHDWADYHLMQVPFLLERVVIVDRAAARSLTVSDSNAGPFAGPSVSQHWCEPVRRSLTLYLGLDESMKTKNPVVTYVHSQGLAQRPQLSDRNHRELVDALQGIGSDHGYEVHVVSDTGTGWEERMSAIAKSTIILGVHGHALLDSVYMKPNGRTALMEFFPPGTFTRDREQPVRALGMRYVAWWNDRKLTDDTLPTVVEPRNDEEVPIDVHAVVRAIREELTRS
jgi:hypothetical protein